MSSTEGFRDVNIKKIFQLDQTQNTSKHPDTYTLDDIIQSMQEIDHFMDFYWSQKKALNQSGDRTPGLDEVRIPLPKRPLMKS
jgi:hypothetical protein